MRTIIITTSALGTLFFLFCTSIVFLRYINGKVFFAESAINLIMCMGLSNIFSQIFLHELMMNKLSEK